ncbi:MAG: preprotein translocase subunit YajC [Hyphomicrobiales bacterium]|nr:preprotein translocase subunit YajC [Hyphomicrobiales bacterium]
MFITEAYAQAVPGAGGGSFLVQLLPFVMILLIMYFLIIRPQQKRMKDHRDMIASIKRNDTVVTSGGMIGKVSRIVGDDELLVELAEGVRVRVVRATVSEVRTRGDVREVESRKARSRNDDDDADNDNGDSTDDAQDGASEQKSQA